ncbi:glucokinase [Thermomonospora echinospora]|uniref:Glucokinase n=1 Tax=Thermomonospora echinospora TaxID=1992 RepID=A0A1H6CMJ1_9ACTN|nr:ROK family glucokinase [Thermomonospora echinospora]SEG73835.1 glucokinase [Thermomonospora echinospora]
MTLPTPAPAPATSASPSARLGIGLDVGGTKIAGGVVTENGEIVHRLRVSTPPGADADTTVEVLRDLVDRLRDRHPEVAAVGAGAPGMVRWPEGHIEYAPNNAYRGLALRRRLAEATGLPTVVDNDANAAAWAETCFGKGKGRDNVIVLTVGTGIGGGLVLGGALYRGQTGLGGEVGHIIVNPVDGHECGCGAVGCLEAEASGTALRRMGRQAAEREPDGPIATLAAGTELTGEIVHQAARQGDPTAVDLFDRLGTWLGVGIASLVNVFEPELVIIGGGLVQTGDLLLGPARTAYGRYAFARDLRPLPPITTAALGNEAGIVGTAALALAAAHDAGHDAGLERP